jgi:hypothetical protein
MRDVDVRRRICAGPGGIQHLKCDAAAGGCGWAVAHILGHRVFSTCGFGILDRLHRDRHPLQLRRHLPSLCAPFILLMCPVVICLTLNGFRNRFSASLPAASVFESKTCLQHVWCFNGGFQCSSKCGAALLFFVLCFPVSSTCAYRSLGVFLRWFCMSVTIVFCSCMMEIWQLALEWHVGIVVLCNNRCP